MADLVWSDPDPEKEDFAISPRFVLSDQYCIFLISTLEAQDTHLAQASFTNSSKPTACHTSSERISFVWKAMLLSSINTFPRYGLHPITAIGAVIQLVYWKSDQEMPSFSMYLRRHPKMKGMVRVNKLRRMLVERFVSPSLFRYNPLIHFRAPNSFRSIFCNRNSIELANMLLRTVWTCGHMYCQREMGWTTFAEVGKRNCNMWRG
jgi:hypothetical protein